MKVYLVCDYSNDKARNIKGTPNCGVEYLGNCGGRLLLEDGTEIGRHHSSTIDFLREDLLYKLSDESVYEIVDLLREEVPESFKLMEN